MKADIERLRVGQAPAPVSAQQKPTQNAEKGAPPAPPVPLPPSGAGVSIPEEPTGGGMGKKILVGLVVLVIVGLLAVLVSSFLGGEPEATPTPAASPAPTTSATLRPSVRDLTSYFGQRSATLGVNSIPSAAGSGLEAYRAFLNERTATQGTAVSVALSGAQSAGQILEHISSSFWVGEGGETRTSVTAFGDDYAFLVFGQSEIFDQTGRLVDGENPQTKPAAVLVLEATDATAVRQAMESWESGNFSPDAAYVLDYDTSAATVSTFSDATYRQIPVRYRNFPYADRSVDWAIVPASNGVNYLVITGSRQSMFFAIDQLLK